MRTDLKLLPLLAAGLAVSGSCVAGETYTCPGTVHLASAVVAPEDIPPGYEAWISDSVIRLSGNNLYDGPPKYMGQLKPESFDDRIATWALVPGKYPSGVWISCDYAGGLVKLTARVKESATSCVARTEKVKPHDTLAVRLVCE